MKKSLLIKILNIAVAFGAIGLVLILITGLEVPVYNDETEWKFIISRLFLDHGLLLYLFPACKESIFLNVPLTWYPSMFLNSFLFDGAINIDSFRVIGTFCYLGLWAFWSFLSNRIFFGQNVTFKNWLFGVIILCAITNICAIPFVLQFHRPEQPILILLTCFLTLLIFFEYAPEKLKSSGHQVWSLSCLLFLSLLFFAGHPKSLFFLPLILFILFRIVKKPAFVVFGLVGILYIAFETYRLWSWRAACAGDPFLEKILMNLNLSPALFIHHFSEALEVGLNNLRSSHWYLDRVMYQKEFQNIWLPNIESVTSLQKFLNFIIYFPLFIWVNICCYCSFVHLKSKSLSRVFFTPGLLLGFTAVLIAFFQKEKNFYEVGLFYPLIVLSLLFLLFSILDSIKQERFVRCAQIFIILILFFSFLNGLSLFSAFYSNLKSSNTKFNEILKQSKVDTNEVAKACGFKKESDLPVVLDSFTYRELGEHEKVFFSHYVDGWWATGVNTKLLLADYKVQWYVARCKDVPEGLAGIYFRSGNICCIRFEK